MKYLILLFIAFSLYQINLTAQGWDPEVTLVSTGDDVEYPDIAVFENNIHVVWEDYRAVPTRQVYYKRSTDHGLSWGPGERLSIDPNSSVTPTIALSQSNVHVVWQDYRDHGGAGGEIYYRRSTNNGDWFEPTIRLTNFVSFKYWYDIAVFEENIHIAWYDDRSGEDIYYIHSTDNGLTWSPEFLITNPSNSDKKPHVSTSGINVFIAWEGYRGMNWEICFRRSTDNGLTWDPEEQLTFSNINAYDCDITSFDNNIHITWVDFRTGPSGEIFYIRSTNYGVDWSAETRLTFNTADIGSGSAITSFQEKVHITWSDNRNPDSEVFYLKSIDNGDNWEAEELLSSIPVNSWDSKVSAFEGDVFVVWQDTPSGGLPEIIFRRYISPTSVDNQIYLPQKFSLAQNYPNPFNPVTTIKYEIPQLSIVTIKVFDVLGNEVETLVNEEKLIGTHTIEFNASNLPSGIYFYQLQTPNFTQTKKMILLK